jgi:AcrR family transcriptional regulator
MRPGTRKALMVDPSFRSNLREEIIAKAGALIETEGLEAVQARRIAREAGCAVGTVYNLFGDIDGLIVAINATTLDMLGGAISAEAESLHDGTLEQRLSRLAMTYVGFALKQRRRWEAVFKHRLPDGREVPTSYIADQNRLLGVIETVIASHIENPEHLRRVARALFGAVHGIVALALDRRLGDRPQSELEIEIGIIVSLVARGLTRDDGTS